MTFYRNAPQTALSRSHELGALPVILTQAPAFIAWVKDTNALSQKLFSMHPQDKRRLQANLDAFNAAVQGDELALEFLRFRTGQAGVGQLPSAFYFPEGPGAIGGWATKTARDDAAAKYQQVEEVLRTGNIPRFPGVGGVGVSATPLLIGGGAVLLLLMARKKFR